jgi:hypothetical protein
LRQVAHDAGFDQRLSNAKDGVGLKRGDAPLAQRVIFGDLSFEVVELALEAIA